jgi:DNA polymerase-3 subunit chi
MATRVELHELPGSKRAGELAGLVEKLYKQRRRVVVWVADEGRLKILDDYLWSFHKLSFVPHAVWTENMGSSDEPVTLLSTTANPNGAEVLVVGDELPPADWIGSFDEVHDFVPAGEAGDERRAFWAQWQSEHGASGGVG